MRAEGHRLGWLLCAALAATIALASPEEDPAALPSQPELAALLSPWAGQWAQLDLSTRVRLEANARRWLALDEAARQDVLSRLAELESLPPARRSARRATRQAWAMLGEDDREAVREAAQRYAQASPEQRERWRAAFDAQDLTAQRSWALGPENGRWLQSVRPLFAFVPAGEREASLTMLGALEPDAREDLRRLVPRLPPAERESFRRRLLEAAPAERAALIRQRLEG